MKRSICQCQSYTYIAHSHKKASNMLPKGVFRTILNRHYWQSKFHISTVSCQSSRQPQGRLNCQTSSGRYKTVWNLFSLWTDST